MMLNGVGAVDTGRDSFQKDFAGLEKWIERNLMQSIMGKWKF